MFQFVFVLLAIRPVLMGWGMLQQGRDLLAPGWAGWGRDPSKPPCSCPASTPPCWECIFQLNKNAVCSFCITGCSVGSSSREEKDKCTFCHPNSKDNFCLSHFSPCTNFAPFVLSFPIPRHWAHIPDFQVENQTPGSASSTNPDRNGKSDPRNPRRLGKEVGVPSGGGWGMW